MAVAIAHTTARLSCDRKTSQVVRIQTSKQVAKPNTFGLPAGASCPGKTDFCKSCYAKNLERAYTAVERLMWSNYEALLACGEDVAEMVLILAKLVDESVLAHDKAVFSGLLPESSTPIFRIHWNGDFYSRPYTVAWREVVLAFPHVQFWAYTRSFEFVGVFTPMPENLALYLSVDEHNAAAVPELLDNNPALLIASCASSHAEAKRIGVEVSGRRPVPCPENTGALPLVVSMTKRRTDVPQVGTDAQGACAACGLCVFGRRDVSFSTTSK